MHLLLTVGRSCGHQAVRFLQLVQLLLQPPGRLPFFFQGCFPLLGITLRIISGLLQLGFQQNAVLQAGAVSGLVGAGVLPALPFGAAHQLGLPQGAPDWTCQLPWL